MEASSSTHPHMRGSQPATPSHPSLLPSLSPSQALEQTPAPLQSLPPHLQGMHSRPGSAQSSHISHTHPHGPLPPQPQFVYPGHMQPPQGTPQAQTLAAGQGNVFGGVMGSGPGQAPQEQGTTKVYASVYSGIAVYEAMIRGISVMRRTSDSWVNATQILKVAGIPKSSRTKILEKEVLTGMHEKVQGGYGKYQGTWIPLERGHELAAQYGVTSYLAPVFEMEHAPGAALPIARDAHERKALKTPQSAVMGYNPGLTPGALANSPYGQHTMQQQQYVNGEGMMMPPGVYAPGMYYAQPHYDVSKQGHGPTLGSALGPAADIGMGLPPSHSEVYIDQYGQPHSTHPTYQSQYGMIDDMAPQAKRQRSDEGDFANGDNDGDFLPEEETQEDGMFEEDDSEDEELRNAPPLPSSFRMSTKPLRPKTNGHSHQTRQDLLRAFAETAEPVDLRAILGIASDAEKTEVDVDIVIDDQGHTALHWATALAKMSLIHQLLDLGADIHRGNYAGETALIRSVLTTNHSEAGTFSELLSTLAESIRTLDHAQRSIIHHIALIAGVKGRAASARAYMTLVLEWVAKEASTEGSTAVGLKTLVDVQDVHGDTALNIAARVGSKALIQLLLEAGADKAKANKLGLKPADFGVEVEALKLSAGEQVVSSLKAEVPKPERRSRDVQKNISAIFETINDTFAQEMTNKQTKLNETENKVRAATRSLADKRQQVARAQSAASELEQIKQKIENARKALTLLPQQDWSGRNGLSREMRGEAAAPPAFRQVQVSNVPYGSGEEVAVPERGSEGALTRLRRIRLWEERMASVLEDKMSALEGESADKAVKYRRLVSLCTKVPVEKVDGLLDALTQAIESDGTSIDLGRVNGILARVEPRPVQGGGQGVGQASGQAGQGQLGQLGQAAQIA